MFLCASFRIFNMKKGTIIIFLGFLMAGCGFYKGNSYTRNWNGSDTPGHNYARFDELSGKQHFFVNLDGQGNGFVNYKVERKGGNLRLFIRGSEKTILDQQIEGRMSQQLSLPSNQNYTITLIGYKASGSFDIQYGTAKN